MTPIDTFKTSYIFIVFFLTLGPLKTIPIFYGLTLRTSNKFRNDLALRTIITTSIISLSIAFIGPAIIQGWGVSIDSLRLAGASTLLIFAFRIITLKSSPSDRENMTISEGASRKAIFKFVLSPLSTPTIITPYGVVAIILYMVIAQDITGLKLRVISILILILFLNYIGMIFSHAIMKFIGVPILELIGWIFAILQASLAIDVILRAFRSLGIIR